MLRAHEQLLHATAGHQRHQIVVRHVRDAPAADALAIAEHGESVRDARDFLEKVRNVQDA
jgi:hypothetical protein